MQQQEVSPRTGNPVLPDMGDTRTAFAQKSDRDLWQALWLFRIIGTPWLTSLGSALTKMALALHLPVKGIVKATIFKQFCGGETIEESLVTAHRLAEKRVGTILDYSVEGEDDQSAMDATAAEILRTVAAAKGNPDIPFSVFKPSGVIRTDVLEKVSAQWGITVAEMKGSSRERVVAHCRKAVAIACRNNGATWTEIAQLLNKHPSTIREMCNAKPLTSKRKTPPLT